MIASCQWCRSIDEGGNKAVRMANLGHGALTTLNGCGPCTAKLVRTQPCFPWTYAIPLA